MSTNVLLLNTSSIICASESVTHVWSGITLMWILCIHCKKKKEQETEREKERKIDR